MLLENLVGLPGRRSPLMGKPGPSRMAGLRPIRGLFDRRGTVPAERDGPSGFIQAGGNLIVVA